MTFGTGAKPVALGESGVVIADVDGLFYNCSVLSRISQMGFSFSQENHFENITNSYFAFAYPVGEKSAIGTNLSVFSSGKISGYDDKGNPTKDYEERDIAFGLYYSRYLLGGAESPLKLSGGVGLKIINGQLGEDTASGLGLDLGFLYTFLVLDKPLTFGLSFNNIGGGLKYYQESSQLPLSLRFGCGYGFNVFGNPLNTLLSFTTISGLSGYPGVGLEYVLKEILFLRVGYILGDEKVGVSGIKLGAGIKLLGINFDYANSNHPVLGTNHLFSIGINFGPQNIVGVSLPNVDSIFNRAVKLYNAGRYAESILEFNKVLELDPTNQEALQYMKKASEKLKK